MGITAVATGLFASMTGVPQYFERKKAARKAERQQERANDIRKSQASVENARNRRRAIAQARVAQAQNAAQQSGLLSRDSTTAGVQGSLTAQLGSNLAAQQQNINAQQGIFSATQSAANALRRGEERAGMYDAFAQTGQTIMSGLYSAGGSFGGTGGSTANSWASQTPGAPRR